MKKRASIYDIASRAGVSVASVSYVLNGKEGRVGDKTKKKIEKAIEDLHYTPSNAAVSLSTGKSHLIGLCLPLDHLSDFSKNPFYGEFMASFQEEAGKSSYDVVIGGIRTGAAFEQWVSSRHFDALVLFGFYPQTAFSFIRKRKIPAVVVDVYQEDLSYFSCIRLNDERGGYLATDYLIQNGHTKIGFLGGPKDRSELDKRRYEGYKEAMEHAGLEIDPENVYETTTDFKGGFSLAEKILERPGQMSAVFADADIIAIGLLRRFAELGVSVPEKLSIVGFDDLMESSIIFPPLTTVRQDISEKGKLAAQTLLQQIEAPDAFEPRSIVLEPKLIVRKTVKKLG